MIATNRHSTIGVLLSGGLDSCVLAAHLLEQGNAVQPFYVRSQLVWERNELHAVRRFLRAIASPKLRDLVILDLPVTDLYDDHWSVTGRDTPGAETPDEAVYLPGRNALLVIKAAIWCQLNGIERLALAPLGSSPFADASPEFFNLLQAALQTALDGTLEIIRPFAAMKKQQVMELGRGYPLDLTFSCIAPVDGQHCGHCNKCGERRSAFKSIGATDPTQYAAIPMASHL